MRRSREPGIDRRIKAFSDEFIENDPDTIESMESDFMNVSEAHKQFEKEETTYKQKISSFIVGRKYFGEKTVNFLTWSEKEQIRLLCQKDPDEWTPSKLSESFPADPLTISKIIKSRWQPKDLKRIQKHDESVRSSWKKFKAGDLEVDPILAEHLKKFAHRNFNNIAKPQPNRKLGTEVPRPSGNEFLSIITSCKKYSEDPPKFSEGKALQLGSDGLRFPRNFSRDPEEDSCLLEGKITGNVGRSFAKAVPLKEYQKSSPDIDLPEKLQSFAQEEQEEIEPFKKIKSVDVNALSINEKKVFKSLEIQELIAIPKRLWKKDQIYKVGDCFYADDGEFLYRVPGLK